MPFSYAATYYLVYIGTHIGRSSTNMFKSTANHAKLYEIWTSRLLVCTNRENKQMRLDKLTLGVH